ncbi:MAG: ComF family protein [Endozoicomonas sp.]
MNLNQVYNWINIKRHLAMHCLLCRGITSCLHPICPLCVNAFPFIDSACSHCGLPLTSSDTGLCRQCLNQPPDFDHCLSPLVYAFPVSRALQSIKYQSRLELVRPITRLLVDLLEDQYIGRSWPEAMVPVPLHPARLRKRGYNQALLLARSIRRQLNTCPPVLDDRLLKRTRATDPQQGLDATARRRNIRQAFTLNHSPPWQHIALVDDVVTTGATVSEIARLLKRSGVRQVDIWSIARTPDQQ